MYFGNPKSHTRMVDTPLATYYAYGEIHRLLARRGPRTRQNSKHAAFLTAGALLVAAGGICGVVAYNWPAVKSVASSLVEAIPHASPLAPERRPAPQPDGSLRL